METDFIELGQSDQLSSSLGTLWDEKLVKEFGSIPVRLTFKIGEAAELLGVKQYVLRFWETEFSMLRPKKSKTGQRVYTRKDIEWAFLIRKLLHRDRFSIEGARTALRGASMKGLRENVEQEYQKATVSTEGLSAVKERLLNLSCRIETLRKIFD